MEFIDERLWAVVATAMTFRIPYEAMRQLLVSEEGLPTDFDRRFLCYVVP